MKRAFYKIGICFVLGIIIMSLVLTILILYRHKVILTDYVISNDYSYVISSSNKNKIYTRIERLPNSINEELDGVIWKGCVENDSSKAVDCYLYNYNDLSYLKVIITDNKLLQTDESEVVNYYVENKSSEIENDSTFHDNR